MSSEEETHVEVVEGNSFDRDLLPQFSDELDAAKEEQAKNDVVDGTDSSNVNEQQLSRRRKREAVLRRHFPARRADTGTKSEKEETVSDETAEDSSCRQSNSTGRVTPPGISNTSNLQGFTPPRTGTISRRKRDMVIQRLKKSDPSRTKTPPRVQQEHASCNDEVVEQVVVHGVVEDNAPDHVTTSTSQDLQSISVSASHESSTSSKVSKTSVHSSSSRTASSQPHADTNQAVVAEATSQNQPLDRPSEQEGDDIDGKESTVAVHPFSMEDEEEESQLEKDELTGAAANLNVPASSAANDSFDFRSIHEHPPVNPDQQDLTPDSSWDTNKVYFNEFTDPSREQHRPRGTADDPINVFDTNDWNDVTVDAAFGLDGGINTSDDVHEEKKEKDLLLLPNAEDFNPPATFPAIVNDDRLDPTGWPIRPEGFQDPEPDDPFQVDGGLVALGGNAITGDDDDDENLLSAGAGRSEAGFEAEGLTDILGSYDEEDSHGRKEKRIATYSTMEPDEASLAARSESDESSISESEDESAGPVEYEAQADQDSDTENVLDGHMGEQAEVIDLGEAKMPESREMEAFASFEPAAVAAESKPQSTIGETSFKFLDTSRDSEFPLSHPPGPDSTPDVPPAPRILSHDTEGQENVKSTMSLQSSLPLLAPPPAEKLRKWEESKGSHMPIDPPQMAPTDGHTTEGLFSAPQASMGVKTSHSSGLRSPSSKGGKDASYDELDEILKAATSDSDVFRAIEDNDASHPLSNNAHKDLPVLNTAASSTLKSRTDTESELDNILKTTTSDSLSALLSGDSQPSMDKQSRVSQKGKETELQPILPTSPSDLSEMSPAGHAESLLKNRKVNRNLSPVSSSAVMHDKNLAERVDVAISAAAAKFDEQIVGSLGHPTTLDSQHGNLAGGVFGPWNEKGTARAKREMLPPTSREGFRSISPAVPLELQQSNLNVSMSGSAVSMESNVNQDARKPTSQSISDRKWVCPPGHPSPFESVVSSQPIFLAHVLSFLGDPVAVCRMKMTSKACYKYIDENEHQLMRDAVRLGGMSMNVRPYFWLWVTIEKCPQDESVLHRNGAKKSVHRLRSLEQAGRDGKWNSVIERDVSRSFGNLPPHKTGARLRTDSIVRALVTWGKSRLMKRGVKGSGDPPPVSQSNSLDSDETPTDTVSDWGGVTPVGSFTSSVSGAEVNYETIDQKTKDRKGNKSRKRTPPDELALGGNALTDDMKAALQDKLSFILNALAAAHSDVGYCQGMDYVVAHLLRILQDTIRWKAANGSLPRAIMSAPTSFYGNAPESQERLEMYAEIDRSLVVEEVCFRVMDSFFTTYNLRHFYWPELRCLKTCCLVFERLIKIKLPVLADHFEHHELNVGLFALGWFQTLFLYLPSMPSATVCHMWDIWLVERSFKIFFRVGTAILFLSQPILLNHELEGMLGYLNTFPDATLLSPDILIACALQIKVTNRLLMQIEEEVTGAV